MKTKYHLFCNAAAIILILIFVRSVDAYIIVSQELESRAYTASSSYHPDVGPDKAFDGNLNTQWNSGTWPTGWIEIDLGKPVAIVKISLSVQQTPSPAFTEHEVWLSMANIKSNTFTAVLAHTFAGTTTNYQLLSAEFDKPKIARYVQVRTTKSPSWVAWNEIQIMAAEPESIAGINAQNLHLVPDLRLKREVPIVQSRLDKYRLEEITILRNSIFAQRGRRFKTPWIRRHFEKQDWYHPKDDYAESMLSPIDKKNAEKLKAYEEHRTVTGVPTEYTEGRVLLEGLCENTNSKGETERFMFDEHDKLQYEREVNGNIEESKSGLWGVDRQAVSYRFSPSDASQYLYLILGKHKCGPVTAP